jgi:GT2 family glycosyltransferase
MKKVSIILVNYNNYQDTIGCVYSLMNIYYKNIEIIIVDNFSNNESVSILKREFENIKSIHLILSDRNLGFSGGNNLGIKYALEKSTDYILMLNNDTIVEKNFLDKVIEYYENNNEIGIITGKIKYFNNPSIIWYAGGNFSAITGMPQLVGANCKDDGKFGKIREITFACGCFMLMSAEVFNKVGLMPEEYFLYFEDTAYSLKVLSYGYKLVFFPESVIYHKVSASTGKYSKIMQYYFTRNGYYFIKMQYNGFKEYITFIYYTYCILKKVVSGKYQLTIVIKGLIDSSRNRMGNMTYNFL